MAYPEIWTVIVTYNAMKWAERCFTSLRNSSLPLHVIVVDNGSTDGTQSYIKNNFPEVELIEPQENLGFGKANNIGIEKAYKHGADFFYLMNQDAWIFEDTISNLISVYSEYPDKNEIGIISPVHLNGTEKKLDIFIDKYIAQNFENRMISDLYFNSLKNYYEFKFVNAAHWLLPKSTIQKVGGFNPYFFHYGEDNEYVNRLHFHRKKVLIAANSAAVHDGVQRLDKVNADKYPDLTVETNMMNPAIENSINNELKFLRRSIMKNYALGNIMEAKKLHARYKKIRQDLPQLKQLANSTASDKAAFLNLQRP